jgi:hypothetical protein
MINIQEDISVRSESDIGEAEQTSDDDIEEAELRRDEGERMEEEDEEVREGKGEEGGRMGSMFQMMNHIQTLISKAVENAKKEDSVSGKNSFKPLFKIQMD